MFRTIQTYALAGLMLALMASTGYAYWQHSRVVAIKQTLSAANAALASANTTIAAYKEAAVMQAKQQEQINAIRDEQDALASEYQAAPQAGDALDHYFGSLAGRLWPRTQK